LREAPPRAILDSESTCVKVELLYGRSGLAVDLADDLRPTVIRKHPMNALEDPLAAICRALSEPVGSPPLLELAAGKRSACIVICDVTRPVPNGLLLPPLLDTLTRAGIPPGSIRILVATGLHRPNEGAELREVVGSDDVLRRFSVENHFARDRAAHVDLGVTSDGVPIMVDRRLAEAELRIVVGLVEPHFMAGYSGGRKVVAPGVAYQDTILAFHSAWVLEHPRAANCVLEGNPLHRAQIEIVRALGEVFALNVVIDEARRLGFVSFGEIEASHLAAVAFMRPHAEVALPRRFCTVLTTSAGYPLDATYYQTVKGMVGVTGILSPGGTIVIASECSRGMGSREFVQAQRLLCRLGADRFVDTARARERALIDEWQSMMLLKATGMGKVKLYATGLSEADRRDVFVDTVDSVAEAVASSARLHGDPAVAVVPEGPYVIPAVGARETGAAGQ
jgi:nickel-dependent lactate racemase